MRFDRIFVYLVGLAAAVLSFLVYVTYIDSLGFPDGFITELGYAQRNLAYLFISGSVALGLYCIYLGAIAARQEVRKKLLTAVVLYAGFTIGLLIIDFYYRLSLQGSGGG